ncbi:MAG: ABC transporter permease [Gammaproteobacteria bacterium]|nr:ABC transporter permease [Gammaproteobacteria bacterium]
MFAKLALQSLLDRKGSVVLSIMAMTVSIFVLLGVEHVRHQVKDSFSNTVSGTDLIVGARTGSLNLLLYSVFRIGSPTNNIHWQSFETIAANPKVKWAIPISLGDSHKGFRVLGTTRDYFEYFSYGKQRHLAFEQGEAFNDVFDVVLGSEVAKKLAYKLGDKVVLAHGVAETSFSLHDDRPFQIVGILKPTGTPVDQTLHVSLQGIEAIHIDWQHGVKIPGSALSQSEIEQADLQPKSITAFMLGLKSKIATFRVQREINQYTHEPMMAILPGVALSELWQMMRILENTLLLVSALVFVAACLGVSALLLSSIRERSREIQLLRAIGASPSFLFLLIELEAVFITLSSIVLGMGLLAGSLVLSQGYLLAHFGLHIESNVFTLHSLILVSAMAVASIVVAFIPSLIGYYQARTINK